MKFCGVTWTGHDGDQIAHDIGPSTRKEGYSAASSMSLRFPSGVLGPDSPNLRRLQLGSAGLAPDGFVRVPAQARRPTAEKTCLEAPMAFPEGPRGTEARESKRLIKPAYE